LKNVQKQQILHHIHFCKHCYTAKCEASFSDNKKIHWANFYSYLIVFSELFGTNFKPQFLSGIDIGLKLFLIYALEMLKGAI